MKYLLSLLLVCTIATSYAFGAAEDYITLISETGRTTSGTSSVYSFEDPQGYGYRLKARLISTANVTGTLDVLVQHSHVCAGGEPESYWKTMVAFPQVTSGSDNVSDGTLQFGQTEPWPCVRVKWTIAASGDYDFDVILASGGS